MFLDNRFKYPPTGGENLFLGRSSIPGNGTIFPQWDGGSSVANYSMMKEAFDWKLVKTDSSKQTAVKNSESLSHSSCPPKGSSSFLRNECSSDNLFRLHLSTRTVPPKAVSSSPTSTHFFFALVSYRLTLTSPRSSAGVRGRKNSPLRSFHLAAVHLDCANEISDFSIIPLPSSRK